MLWFYILVLLIGYFIGSISPAYILCKVMKGIDIRKYGTKNAGAMNAFQVLGRTAGLITLIFDFIKGILAMFIAYLLIIGMNFNFMAFTGQSFVIICLAGFAAILGHVFPFYLKFKGGKGAATAGGLIITLLIFLWGQEILFGISWLTWIPFIIILFFGFSIFIITKSVNLAGFISYSLMAFWFLIFKDNLIAVVLALYLFYLLLASIVTVIQKNGLKQEIKFVKRKKKEIKFLRKILRFAFLVFPIVYFWTDKIIILIALGILFLLFLVFDLTKKRKGIFSKIFKKAEAKIKISGPTLFLFGALITTAFFQKEFAILALIFAAVGDNAAVLFGIPFGRIKLFRKKTLEGTLACFVSCFFAGLIIMPFLNIHFLIILFGAIAATLAELFSGRYDNLTMAPFAAAVMGILVKFV